MTTNKRIHSLHVRGLALMLAAGLLAAPAFAWGPKAQLTFVSNALHLLSKDSNIPLVKLQEDVLAGAKLSQADLLELHPELAVNPVEAITSEMYLLATVQSGKVDSYLAYRLGALGVLVTMAMSPMQATPESVAKLYFVDADANINNLALKPVARQAVDPKLYFERMIPVVNSQNDIFIKEYQQGVSGAGASASTLSEIASYNVNAVADVWQTVMTRGTAAGNVSEAQLRRYVLGAYRFYIDRKNPDEIDKAATRLDTLVAKTPDMQDKIGDMYFSVELYDRAMDEYRAVLETEPNNRTVVEKISNYFVSVGNKALENGKLEDARDAFTLAAETDPMHPEAGKLRLEAETLIRERDARMAADQDAIKRGDDFFSLAQQEALSNRFPEAVALVLQAQAAYNEVSEEFPEEAQAKKRGLRDTEIKIQVYKKQVSESVQAFSGSDPAQEIRALAIQKAQEVDRLVLETLLKNAYDAELKRLEQKMAPTLILE